MTSQDTLSTNLFPSPNITPNNNNTTTTAIDSSPDGREREGEIIQGTQLLQAIQVCVCIELTEYTYCTK